jgi:fructose-bisphosphate aldolase class I
MDEPAKPTLSLNDAAKLLVSDTKGILATDATDSTMDKRMTEAGITPTPQLRAKFREILLNTPGYEQYISGVILNDEIIRQSTSSGVTFANLLLQKNILVGIKVDKKTHNLANYPGEKIVEGLDGLRERLVEYKSLGAKFSKWRAVIIIGEKIPTRECIDTNAHATARYAALSQEAGIVPIVEPEVEMKGSHDIERCAQVTAATLRALFYHLNEQKVDLTAMILKINMVLPGSEYITKSTTAEVAQKTLEVMQKSVPPQVPGIVFLSGGQDAVEATGRLNEIVKLANAPWKLSFSFERALEGPALTVWKGLDENITLVQNAFYHRAKMNSLARQGKYSPDLESNG